MEHLFEKLKLHNEADIYPYHMPGHKRQPWGELPKEIFQIDITEIDGFDNLHQPEEILKELQMQAATIYGAEESFYLINGSTCGILSAISSVLPEGGHILMARNCHKSAYHGAYLRNLTISYLYPKVISKYDIYDAISSAQVEEALEKEPEIGAVLIVSPTYEGRIADVRAIAEIVHRKGIPLIVDEAHGAHLGLAEGFAKNSCQCGADLVIHSVHKTLPAMTQTALMHVNGTLINREKLKRFLRIYQSSSPSYVLMASIDNALRFIQSEGAQAFAQFRENYHKMCRNLSECKTISLVKDDWNRQDVGKLVISVKDSHLTGKELYNILRKEYHLQLEMAAETYVLAMFTVNDCPEAYNRMESALLALEAKLQLDAVDLQSGMLSSEGMITDAAVDEKDTDFSHELSGKAPLPLHQAWDGEGQWISLENALDKPVADFVNLYPPGIPLLVPGEYMTDKVRSRIQRSVRQNLNVQGILVQGVSEANCEGAECSVADILPTIMIKVLI